MKLFRKIYNRLSKFFVTNKFLVSQDSSFDKNGRNKLLKKNKIILRSNSHFSLDQTSELLNCKIDMVNSKLIILDGCRLTNVELKLIDSIVFVGSGCQFSNYRMQGVDSKMTFNEKTILEKGKNSLNPYIQIDSGVLIVGNNNVIRSDFWIRFGGNCMIGIFNCINEKTEIRCDENIKIGDFNMISYECNIWDTNTHCLYDKEKRRSMTLADFPIIGKEFEKPKTKPITIGNDCWIGKRSFLLKGTKLNDSCVVGAAAVVSNMVVTTGKSCVGNPAVLIN